LFNGVFACEKKLAFFSKNLYYLMITDYTIHMKNYIFCLLTLFNIGACSNPAGDTSNKSTEPFEGALFTLLDAKDTGIDFVNVNKQDVNRNIFSYHYYFNGGGVAIADFDNDGLPDVFFTANMGSDKLYHNKGNLKFEDITQTAGVDGFGHGLKNTWSTGVTIADVNNDGYMDIYICKSGLFPKPIGLKNLLYVNNKNLTFTEMGSKFGVDDEGHSTQAVFFDYDQDRDLDLYVMNHSVRFAENIYTLEGMMDQPGFQAQHSGNFYKNEGGKFIKITEEVGLNKYGYGLGVVASDINHDGWTDLYVANDFSRPDAMYINQKNGTFKDEVKTRTGHVSYYSMGCDIADINNDGLVDIHVVDMAPADNLRSKTLMPSMNTQLFWDLHDKYGHQYQYMFNALQLNQGEGKFSEIAKLSGVHKTDWSWATLLADYDNDGHKDLFVSNGYKRNAMDNDFSKEFAAMKVKYNNNPPNQIKQKWLNKPPSYKLKNQIYKNKGDLKFEAKTEAWGMDINSFSNGAAYADLDLDGDLDLVVNNIDDPAFIYRNNASGNNYLQIKLSAGNRYLPSFCWNAKVKIFTSEGIQYQELSPTRGFQSVCDATLHFGLGQVNQVDRIEVTWPDGITQFVENTKANQVLHIDKTKAQRTPFTATKEAPIFEETSGLIQPNFVHQENEHNDFIDELLLPHKNSEFGPFLSVGDANGDGLEDFYVGGASGQSGQLYLQTANEKFKAKSNPIFTKDKKCEDMDSQFIDVDQDGDLDLYVVSGGNEFPANDPVYKDRLYINDGKGNYTKKNINVPNSSGSCAVKGDFNKDGKTDLFVGGRMVPKMYPKPSASLVLLSEAGTLVADKFAAPLDQLGIVTSATAADIDQDGDLDLVIGGEWEPIRCLMNEGDRFVLGAQSGLENKSGWWSSLTAADIDQDGDLDLIAGNLGLNYKYKASEKEPFHIYLYDFDESGSQDIVLGYFNEGICYPLRGRGCSSEQMPFLKEKFPTYHDFGSADLKKVYGDALEKAYHREASYFSNAILRNDNGKFSVETLPNAAQISNINAVITEDFDQDNNLEILLAGNLFASEVETPRNDAGVGLLLDINDKGEPVTEPMSKSGVYLPGDVKDIQLIKGAKGNNILVVANNNEALTVLRQAKPIN